MSESPRQRWVEANQRALVAAIGVCRARLARARGRGEAEAIAEAEAAEAAAEAALPAPSALARLVEAFGLTPFERGILLLCAGRELDAALGALLDAAGGAPTLSLAAAALPEPHWDALAPGSPLRRGALVVLRDGAWGPRAPLALDERVLNFLAGIPHMDARLEGLFWEVEPPVARVPSQEALALRVLEAWRQTERPLVQLCGTDARARRAVSALAGRAIGLSTWAISAADLPEAPADRGALARLWSREAVLGRHALLVELESGEPEPVTRRALAFLDEVESPATLAGSEAVPGRRRLSVHLDVGRPTPEEQRALWDAALGERADALAAGVDRLVAHYDLGPERILASVASAGALPAPPREAEARLWDATRREARPALEGLAARIATRAGWDDLVIPEAQRRVLEEMVVHARRRQKVSRDWGFGARTDRGLGLTALFAGPSGTGKTLAAEVLASALGVDLYRVDLSATVSKYIGETEKNLRRIFDAAEGCGAILLFDEADALFGKRSEVKDSHDRYANLEVSYLLQRMESYGGLAVLTTNLKDHLDQAFLRRIRFLVQFPFPGREQRAEIWRRAVPRETPTQGLDYGRLAQLNVAGGNIRNIAFNAAVLAADEGVPLGMAHLLRAARSEYAKLEQPLTAAEIGGWR